VSNLFLAQAQTHPPNDSESTLYQNASSSIFLPVVMRGSPNDTSTTCETHADGSTHCHGDDHIDLDKIPSLDEEARIMEIVERLQIGRRQRTEAEMIAANEHLVGKWAGPYNWPVVAIHASLMPNGKVLAFDSVGDNPTESYSNHTFTRATVWNPETNLHTNVQVNTGYNLFCAGFSNLTNGHVFTAGGNKNSALDGINRTHTFNPNTNAWTLEGTMSFERWYPSVTPLNNGEVLITGGGANVPEIRNTSGGLRKLTGANAAIAHDRIYHWLKQAPNGRVFYIGPSQNLQYLNTSGNGSWQSAGTRDNVYRDYGSHAMYDIGKILVTGGGSNAVKSAVVININGSSPSTSATNAMAFRRKQHNLSVLPDGTVLAVGGHTTTGLVDVANAVYAAERWNPATGQWTTLASMTVARHYHSLSMLLPDGRVLVAGGGICGECQTENYLAKNAEIFSPPYLFKTDGSGQLATRPQISSAPSSINLNQVFNIDTPQASGINKVSLVRLSSVTHSTNMEERFIPLSFTRGSGVIQATASSNANIAPPGYYMLFIVDDAGVPSVAKIVFVSNTVAPTPTPVPPTQTPTKTSTPSPTPTKTNTPAPNTATSTQTPTKTSTPTLTPTKTNTPAPNTATPTPIPTLTSTSTPAPNNASITINVQQTNYTPLSGWTVNAQNLGNGSISSLTTNANGMATFNLSAGSYKICEVLQAGWSNVYPGNECYWMTFSAGSNISLFFRNELSNAPTNTPIPPTATPPPGGNATVTVNVQQTNFAPLSGWTVTAENLSTNSIATLTTDANGAVVFSLPAGSYKICETLQSGWANVFPGSTCYWMTLSSNNLLSLSFRNQQ
jgi:hypothetical protein